MARAKTKEAPAVNTSLVILPPPPPRGRPSLYTDELAAEICERIAAGETLTSICEEEDMPADRTVAYWLQRRPEFFADYERARETQSYLEDDQARDIADNLTILPEHKRVMIETRKWRAERLNRRIYGAKIAHEHALTPDPAHDPERLPAGLNWLAGAIEGGRDEPEQRDSGVGET